MALATQTRHKQLTNTALPYKTFTSPIDQSPQFVAGRNVLTTQKGFCTQRPGFADFLEVTATQFVNVQRIFPWTRFDGTTHIVMLTDIIGGIPRVYKYVIGVDISFALIHVATAQSSPYNFVTANNVVYFSNDLDCWKWSPTIGLERWGISPPGSSGQLSELATAGANSGSGSTWNNPGNVGSTSAFATVDTSELGSSTNLPNRGGYIAKGVDPSEDGTFSTTGNGYAFAIPAGATIIGIQVNFNRWASIAGLTFPGTDTSSVQLMTASGLVGIPQGPGDTWSLTSTPEVYGGPADLWGAAWTAADVNNNLFGVSVTVEFTNYDSVHGGVLHVPNFSITVFYSVGSGSPISQTLTASTFGFAAPATFSVSGIVATFNASSTGSSHLQVQLVVGGNPVGSPKSISTLPSSPTQFSLGGLTDLWGYRGILYSDVNAANFGLAFIASDGNATTSVNDVVLTVYSTGAPSVSLTAGGLTTTNGGFQYLVTYENSTTGHESSPSPLSVSTGDFASKDVVVGYGASSDPQVDRINIYRTTDGGSANPQQMAFLTQVPNSTSTYTDSITDAQLSSTRFAPAFYQNDPPPPMSAICSYAGRVWGAKQTEVWYSGQEEISNGVPQECFPGASIHAADGNFYAYASTITGIAPLPDGVAPFTPKTIEKIEGDSLDTFRRYTMLTHRGTLSRASVKTVGSSVTWFDVAHQAWLSDLGEIGKDIRPDLRNVGLTTCQIAIHIAGEQHWVVVTDPDNSLLYIYDLDTNQWMVPWTVNASCVESIETAAGETRLAIALNGTSVMLLNNNLNVDNGEAYPSYCVVNPIALELENPEYCATVAWIDVETNQFNASSVGISTDEDVYALLANGGSTTTLTKVDPPSRRRQGQFLQELQYKVNSAGATVPCRRVAVRLDWDKDTAWAWYTFDVANIPFGR